MLSILDPLARGSRRDFLRIGGLSLGGLTLADLLRTEASAAGRSVATDKSVVFLFMHSGPSQIEMFDPKMTAPSGIHCINGEVQTARPQPAREPRVARVARRRRPSNHSQQRRRFDPRAAEPDRLSRAITHQYHRLHLGSSRLIRLARVCSQRHRISLCSAISGMNSAHRLLGHRQTYLSA